MLSMDEVFSEQNQREALESFAQKKDGHGEDGITVADFPEYWEMNSEIILGSIRDGNFTPGVVTTYEILGKTGKRRVVSVMNVTDRLITRMLSQKMKPIFEADFFEYSYAYQEGKGILDAVKQAQKFINSGKRFVVDIDIRAYFDNIDLPLLLSLIEAKVDSDVMALIRKYLFCKVRSESGIYTRQKGLVQGSPLSPLLSNIYLHEFDKQMEEKGYNWIRFADDIKIYAESQETAAEIYNFALKALKIGLKLTVNEGKSGVYSSMERWVLGYEFYKYAGKVEVRKHKYRRQVSYGSWHPSGLQKVNQEYHIVRDGVLNKQDYSILFESEDQKKHIPVEATEQISIYADVTISPAVLKLLAAQNIRLIYVNKYGENIGYFTPVKSTKDAKAMLEQVRLYTDVEKRKEIARKMEIASFHNMRSNLRYYNKKQTISLEEAIHSFDEMIKQVNEAKTVEEMMITEARARQQYYQCFNLIVNDRGFVFEKRTKRPPKDEINAMISFGNTLLYNAVLKAIWKTSLDPKIGVVHATNRRAYSLNLDFADIFKPIIVDRVIFSLINRLQIKKDEHFTKLADDSVLLNDKGRLIFIEEFQEKLADKIVMTHKQVTYRELLLQEVYHFQNYLLRGDKYKPYKYY